MRSKSKSSNANQGAWHLLKVRCVIGPLYSSHYVHLAESIMANSHNGMLPAGLLSLGTVGT